MKVYIRHLETALLLLVLLIVIGTFSYTKMENWSPLDALYMTVITISTVGFSEIHPISDLTRLFTIGLIFSSIAVIGYLLGSLTQILIVGEIATLLGRKRLENKIRNLKNHVIICGFGRVGSVIAKELLIRKIPIVVIEANPDTLFDIEKSNLLYIQSNAVEDEILLKAGIKHASCLITTLPSDPDNVFITLSAHSINPKLFIISRASQENTEDKLRAAGANEVVSPHRIGAHRMVYKLTKPNVLDFIDYVMHEHELPLEFEEITIHNHSHYANKKLIDSKIRQDFDLIIVAIKKSNNKMIFNPKADTLMEPRDVLISMGTPEHLTAFKRTANKLL